MWMIAMPLQHEQVAKRIANVRFTKKGNYNENRKICKAYDGAF